MLLIFGVFNLKTMERNMRSEKSNRELTSAALRAGGDMRTENWGLAWEWDPSNFLAQGTHLTPCDCDVACDLHYTLHYFASLGPLGRILDMPFSCLGCCRSLENWISMFCKGAETITNGSWFWIYWFLLGVSYCSGRGVSSLASDWSLAPILASDWLTQTSLVLGYPSPRNVSSAHRKLAANIIYRVVMISNNIRPETFHSHR